MHYRPRTLLLNNLEFDHADIFDDLSQIQRQFHHLVRTVPGNGLIIAPGRDTALDEVLHMGCWTPVEYLGRDALWHAEAVAPDGSRFRVLLDGAAAGEIAWSLTGRHNMHNALTAIAAARHVGVPPGCALDALCGFENIKRRMELRGEVDGVRVYDDFAHHPTAISTTLDGLRRQVGGARILAVLEPRSNTMRLGVHNASLPAALEAADLVYIHMPDDLGWDAGALFAGLPHVRVFDTTGAIVESVRRDARPGDHVLVMSNGGFENIHQRLLDAL